MWCPCLMGIKDGEQFCYARGASCHIKEGTDEEQKKCYEVSSLCGFLAPDGSYYPCNPYGHTVEAEKICREVLNVQIRSIDAENYLLINSWVALYARHAGFLATGYLPVYKGGDDRQYVRFLSDKQIRFLEDALRFCPIETKYDDIREILDEDYHLKNDPAYKKLFEGSVL